MNYYRVKKTEMYTIIFIKLCKLRKFGNVSLPNEKRIVNIQIKLEDYLRYEMTTSQNLPFET